MVLCAACGTEPGTADPAGSSGTSVAVDGPSSADCADPLAEPEAVATRVRNWRLQYAPHCPAVDAAIDNCSRLRDVSAEDRHRCLDENIALAESCPNVAREALREVLGEGRRADRCRAASRAAVDEALAAYADAIAPHLLANVDALCRGGQPPAAAERCVVEKAGMALAATEAIEEKLVPHEDLLTDDDVAHLFEYCLEFARTPPDEAAACAARLVAVYLGDIEQEDAFLAAARDALRGRVPQQHVDRLAAACVEPAFAGTEDPADCGARLGDAQGGLLEALEPLPDDQHERVVARCLHQRGVVDRDLRLPNPACVASEAADYAALHHPASGYSAAERDPCTTTGYTVTWTARHDCVRRQWLSRERVAAIKAEAIRAAVGRLERAFMRPAVADRCDYAIPDRGSELLSRIAYLPGEHPRDLVRRRVAQCVDGEAAGFDILVSLAGTRHADALERCTESILGRGLTKGRSDWADAAECLGDRARERNDQPLAELLRRCRPWSSSGAAERFPACVEDAP